MGNKKTIRVLTIAYNFCPRNNAEALVATRLLNVDSDINYDVYTLDIKCHKNTNELGLVKNLKVIQIDNHIAHFLPNWKIFNNKYTWAIKVYNKSKDDNFNVIYTRSTPIIDHFIGLLLKVRTGKPWVVHLSDPWLDSPYRRKKPILDFILEYFQNLLFTKSDLIIVTNDNFSMFLKKHHPKLVNKIRIILHPMKIFSVPSSYKKNTEIVISHLGLFYEKRSPDPFLELLDKLSTRHIRLNLVGNNRGDKVFSKIGKYSIADRIVFLGHKSYEESINIGLDSNYLLLIDANLPDKKLFLPSKLVDYLAMRKPIIAMTNRESPVHKILEERDEFLLFYEDPDEVNIKKINNIIMKKERWGHDYFEKISEPFDVGRNNHILNKLFLDLC